MDLPNVQRKVVKAKFRREMDAVAPLCKALCEGYSTLDPAFAGCGASFISVGDQRSTLRGFALKIMTMLRNGHCVPTMMH